MPRCYLLSLAAAIMVLIAGSNFSYGAYVAPNSQSAIAPAVDTLFVRGGHRGHAAVRVRGPHGGGAVAVRGPHGGRGVAVRGPHGGGRAVAVHGGRAVAGVRGPRGGAIAVGRRYGGGVWYGPGRRFWRGRWYAYGVGSCWRWTDIGYVWICGY